MPRMTWAIHQSLTRLANAYKTYKKGAVTHLAPSFASLAKSPRRTVNREGAGRVIEL